MDPGQTAPMEQSDLGQYPLDESDLGPYPWEQSDLGPISIGAV